MKVAKDVEWVNIYWVRGALPKGSIPKNAVSDPPCSGWALAFLMRGEKTSLLVCPYSLRAFTVPNACSEIENAVEPKQEFRPDHMRDMMTRNWAQFQGFGWQRDYDTCALLMKRMDWPVPAQVMTGGEDDDRKRGGKDVSSKLLKPVKLSSKRGRFLAWFLEDDGSRSVRETMVEFSMTRSNALSYLYMLQKDHGVGYELVGDRAMVSLPEGCDNPFDAPWPVVDDDDDSWLD